MTKQVALPIIDRADIALSVSGISYNEPAQVLADSGIGFFMAFDDDSNAYLCTTIDTELMSIPGTFTNPVSGQYIVNSVDFIGGRPHRPGM